MPCTHYIDNKAKLLITTWEGNANDIDFIEAVKKYQQDILSNHDYDTYNEIADFRKLDTINISTEGIMDTAQVASTADTKISRKLAFIVNSKLAFGLARMYGTYRSNNAHSNKEIRVFEDERDAYNWVKT